MSLRLSVWRKRTLIWLFMPLALGILVAGMALAAEDAEPIASRLGQMMEPFVADGMPAPAMLEMEGLRLPLHADVVRFYHRRGYRPAWFHEGRLTPAARQWLEHVQGVAAEGLNPSDYHVEPLAVGLELIHLARVYGEPCNPGGVALVDMLLTDAFLKYVSHLLYGRMEAARFFAIEWPTAGAGLDAVAVLHRVLRQQQLAAVLEELVPHHAEYRRLAVYLEHYRRLAQGGGWVRLSDGPILRPGGVDARVPLLRRFLLLVGDLEPGEKATGRRFDASTVAALKRFQARHGLRPDGVLGKETLARINVPVAQRIEQIALNLERQRGADPDPEARYVQVDITDFSLRVFDRGREVMRMPVVVGTAFRRTPVFSSLMTYLVFAPYWTVPPTILEQDKWPHIKADPGYLQAHHFEIVAWGKDPRRVIDAAAIDWKKVTAASFPGMLRQKPGPWNPLGKVKFMFPNAYHVYLHDTPSRHLFQKQQRTFSSGCIRIARPLDLAAYLLEGQDGWDRERIKLEMERAEPHVVRLKRPIPVHILYRTAWVDNQGRLQFRNDVYQRDPELQAVLLERGMTPLHQADAGAFDGEDSAGARVVR